jgi:hypothetical protein
VTEGSKIVIIRWENLYDQIKAGGSKIVIVWWENLSGRIKAGVSKTVIIRWRNLFGLKREDLRLLLFGMRISPDCGGRIEDCHYSAWESLRIKAGGSKIVIIWYENLSGLWGKDPRLSLFGEIIS